MICRWGVWNQAPSSKSVNHGYNKSKPFPTFAGEIHGIVYRMKFKVNCSIFNKVKLNANIKKLDVDR